MKNNIPVFILAGGKGTRISGEGELKPKPMIEIAGTPIIVHIMRFYYRQGFNDFVLCVGHQGEYIKRYFRDYKISNNSIEIDHRYKFSKPIKTIIQNYNQEKWRIRIIDTGEDTMTGSRVALAFDLINSIKKINTFALTYGDGLSDVNLRDELLFHKKHKKIGTVLGVRNAARFGELSINNHYQVTNFVEKPKSKQGFISGGFFYFRNQFRDYLSLDQKSVLENEPLTNLAKDGNLMAYKHDGFWQCMDTLRDKNLLQRIWDQGNAPWISENV
jgi:glucose-1-phosphate cytidylyltransferase